MTRLLLREFDKSARENPHTTELVQWFDNGFDSLKPTGAEDNTLRSDQFMSFWQTCFCTLRWVAIPGAPYWLDTILSIVRDVIGVCFTEVFRAHGCIRPVGKVAPESQPFLKQSRGAAKSPPKREYIFLQFSVWECAAARALENC